MMKNLKLKLSLLILLLSSVSVYAASVSQNVAITITNITVTSTNGSVSGPGGAALIDSAGNSWTISTAGVISENGVVSTGTSGVKEILYYSNTIYQTTGPSNWWSWVSGAWVVVAADPRPALLLSCTAAPNPTAYNLAAGSVISTCTLTGMVSPIIWPNLSDASFALSSYSGNVVNVIVGSGGILAADYGKTNSITVTATQN